MTTTTHTDFEAIAGVRCEEYYEMESGDGGSCNENCKAGCLGTGYRYCWLWREVQAHYCYDWDEMWIRPEDPEWDACTHKGYVLIEHDRTDALLRVVFAIGWHVDSWFDDGMALQIDDENRSEEQRISGRGTWIQGEALASALRKALDIDEY